MRLPTIRIKLPPTMMRGRKLVFNGTVAELQTKFGNKGLQGFANAMGKLPPETRIKVQIRKGVASVSFPEEGAADE